MGDLGPKKLMSLGAIVVTIIVALVIGSNMMATVSSGSYQVKQAFYTGTMSAKMTPGIYCQCLGSVNTWPKAQTFFFTKDSDEGSRGDQSIEVRFVDGSLADISGTLRIALPTNSKQAIDLIDVHGYLSYNDVEQRLVLPVVRKALRLTANMMTARESYAEKRVDFDFWVWDQVQNGVYKTEEEGRMVKDPITGEESYKKFKVIKTDDNGTPLRHENPLDGLGITLANFEVKSYEYSKKVKEQIAAQQEALMRVATAAAEAKAAEQNEKTAEAQGKEAVTKAKYAQEEEKIKAVVAAQQEKEVAELNAQKEKNVAETAAVRDKEVAKLAKEAAEFTKQKDILLGEGEAKRKTLVMEADGALEQKLRAWVEVQTVYAKEFGKQRWVPEIQMGGASAEGGNRAAMMMEILSIQAAKQLGLDMNIKAGDSK